MSSLRDQENLHGPMLPLILNNCNFAKTDPALLSFDDARTLFHEFGHALHGLLSQVHYPRLSGTNVARDFVELPSQLYEHWLEEPEILKGGLAQGIRVRIRAAKFQRRAAMRASLQRILADCQLLRLSIDIQRDTSGPS